LCIFNDLVFSNATLVAGWEINHREYGINAILSGQVSGYSGNVNNAHLIVENIMMNDGRNGTEHMCLLFNIININMKEKLNGSDPIILYVAGKYQYSIMYTVIL